MLFNINLTTIAVAYIFVLAKKSNFFLVMISYSLLCNRDSKHHLIILCIPTQDHLAPGQVQYYEDWLDQRLLRAQSRSAALMRYGIDHYRPCCIQ